MQSNDGIRVEGVAACPLCGGEGRVLYTGFRDRYWDAPGTWSFRRCMACRHLWLDPRPIPEDIGRLYASYFTHAPTAPLPFRGDSFWAVATRGVLAALGYRGLARNAMERWFGRTLRFVPPLWDECKRAIRSIEGPPRGLLVDIGCGNGWYLELMRDLGWAVQGLEPDPVGANLARRRGLDVVERPIEDAVFPDDAFDVITMSHVIEHVIDPVRVLSIARRILRKGGVLLIMTPNAGSWGHRKFGPAWFHLDPPRHLHLFTSANLAACAEKAGLRVTSSRTTGGGHLVYDGSVAIRETGRFRLGDIAMKATARDRWFRAFESVLVRVRPDGGEEILLSCTKGDSD